MKILLVDADQGQRIGLMLGIDERFHQVEQAFTILDAISKLQSETFDLVLIDDLLAEGQHGFAVARLVGAAAPVFLRTNADPEEVMNVADVPANILAAFSKTDRPGEIVEHAEWLCAQPLQRMLGSAVPSWSTSIAITSCAA